MKVSRTNMLKAFRNFVDGGHTVVIGAPGVGKTHTLKLFAKELIAVGQMCVFVPIDHVFAKSEGDLRRELGYKSDNFVDFLASQKLSQDDRGIVIFDAFDAARSEESRTLYLRVIRRIIETIGDRWTVVVSARIYDARKSADLRELFPPQSTGKDSLYSDPSGHFRCRHFFIPKLNDDEMREVSAEIEGLWQLYKEGSKDLRALLRIPFNLLLVERILATGLEIKEVSHIDSEVQLLDLYWKRRIESNRNKEDLRLLLLRASQEMIRERSLSARRERIYDSALNEAWNDLMSLGLLVETSETGQRVAFEHNILFDFIVSFLVIEDTSEGLLNFLSEDHSRALFLRPSLDYFFTRLWNSQPEIFWDIFWSIIPNDDVHIRLFARLLPTTVMVRELKDESEIFPLLNHRNSHRKQGDEAILRLFQALGAVPGLDRNRDIRWAPILKIISKDCSPKFLGDMSRYLSGMYNRADESNDQIMIELCGRVSRNMLNWVWSQRTNEAGKRFDRLAGTSLVPLVAKTFSTNPSASRPLLDQILSLVKEPAFPIDYLYRLTKELKYIWTSDPDFVRQVYMTVFENPETSEEKTYMGTPIMPLSSTRRQDYRMCHYNLKRNFPGFVRAATEEATITAIRSLNPYILSNHVVPYLKNGVKLEDMVKRFPFRNGTAYFISDYSHFWRGTKYPKEPFEIAKALFGYIVEISKESNKGKLLDKLMDLFRDNATAAFFWGQLLKAATMNPKPFVDRIFELCVARPIQISNETVYELSSFVESAIKFFSPEQIKSLEESIISITEIEGKEKEKDFYESHRNRLLNRIPYDLLVTDRGRAIALELQRKKETPSHEPLVKFESWSKPFSEKEWLEEKGVDLNRDENKKLYKYFEPLKQFSAEWVNKKPAIESIRAIFPIFKEAFEVLHKDQGAAKPLEDELWTKIGECSEAMARTLEDVGSEEFFLCRQALLECAQHQEPQPDPEYDSKYDHPSWSPAPRNEAAQGLPWLAIRVQGDPELINTIEILTNDTKPSVRFLVISELWRIHGNYPDSFWQIVEKISEEEKNRVVLQALCRSLSNIIWHHEAEASRILEKFTESALLNDENELLDSYISLVMWLNIVRENEWAQNTADLFLKDPIKFRKALHRATFDALSYVTPKHIEDEKNRLLSERALHWITRSINSAANALRSFTTLPDQEITEETRLKFRDIYTVIDEVVTRLYFASGFFEEHREREPVTHEERKKFYQFIKPILKQVLDVSEYEKEGFLAAPTAHHFMELLNGVLSYDPKGVLSLASRVSDIARAGYYNFDSMAIREVVKIVEAILANNRVDVRDGESLKDLLNLLDIFADIGWPEALQLVWRLDEIFR